MRTLVQTFVGEWPIQAVGKYFRIIEADGVVDVRIYRGSYPIAESIAVGVGFWMSPAGGFDRVDIVSATTQTVKVAISDGEGGYDAMTIVGDVKASPKQGTEINQFAPVTVTHEATLLAAADPLRRELRIKNDGPNAVYLGGATVTAAGSPVKIEAGAMWIEASAAAAEWRAIGANANLVVNGSFSGAGVLSPWEEYGDGRSIVLVSGGKVRITNQGVGNALISQQFQFVANRKYSLSINRVATSGPQFRVSVGPSKGTSTWWAINSLDIGVSVYEFIPQGAGWLTLWINSPVAGEWVEFDDVSIREVDSVRIQEIR